MDEDDPMVEVDIRKLRGMVERTTPFTMPEFEKMVGWCFGMGEAPASKRRLAWDLLNLSEEDMKRLHDMQRDSPTMWFSGVSKWDGSSGAGQ